MKMGHFMKLANTPNIYVITIYHWNNIIFNFVQINHKIQSNSPLLI